MKFDNLHSQRGISLLLMVTMVGGLFFVTSAAVNLIWTVSKSSRTIGESEQAYFAALAAVEQALYEYEKGSGSLNALPVTVALPVPGNAAASYTTSAVVDTLVPTYTATLSATNDPNSPISTSNRLLITIPAGKTLYFNLSTIGVSYPSNIEISQSMGSNIRVTTFSAGAQMSQIFNAPNDKVTLNVPSAGSNDARFMATNLSSASSAIELKPTGGNLPLGIIVTGVGSYKNTERKVEVAKPNWVIY